MITYRCDKDNIECMSSICPVCRERTRLVQTDIFWCTDCQVPLFEEHCGRCGATGKRIGSDIRPVFPEERLLMEAVLGEPMKYHRDSVWNTAGNRYYANGRRIPFSVKKLAQVDADHIREQIEAHAHENTYEYFDRMMKWFVEANQNRYEEIVSEATTYIRNMTQGYDAKDMFVSFSGGKDSTVTGDLVTRALANPRILHIFGDTTLEFPETYAYVERFKKAHSTTTPVLSSRNKDKDFEQLCKLLGPPSRVMRWCCTIFKTGAITRKIQTLFGKKERIVAFYGIRRSESASRSKYDRESNSPKIAKQITVSPIIDWLDFDVWLYLLTTGIDFNRAYRLGYSRVGFWCFLDMLVLSE
ncbi:phosphoadenosine phosphosulfate reductase family protein [Clostridium sp. CAG:590]|nr:phosphoadenosine phosphosulfate reductase family protein [Clostridium sp. CAG:590]